MIEKADIVAIISEYVELTGPHGVKRPYHKGLCPFHDDHDPSFNVFEETQRYKCWSCGASGDAIAFVAHMKGIPYHEAKELDWVARKLDDEEVLQKKLQEEVEKVPQVDQYWMYTRLAKLFDRGNLPALREIQPRLQKALDNGKYEIANNLLRKYKL